ncbi:casein kinase II regulatory subunit-domain-containing protein [Kockiozyma suomiensis]|uniref:casein kinase II regulatory subunit-domain-containing protein n=1 Tax=Kockiozyma suomiensis TaxID=1337062 RepID=UPI0033442315
MDAKQGTAAASSVGPRKTGAGSAGFGESSMMEGVEHHLQYADNASTATETAEAAAEGEVEEEEDDDEEEEEEEEESDEETESSRSEGETWISSFCSIRGHEYFAEVSEDFIEDDFNLTGLSSLVPYYGEALDMILDFETDPDDAARLPNIPVIEASADQLYGLIHARFLLTRQGLSIMAEKYNLTHFGVCPRYLCHSTHLLPIATSDLPGNDTVKLFCPNCADIYCANKENEVDGAYFGATFAGLFLKTYTDIPGPLGGLRIPPSTLKRLESSDEDSKQSSSDTSLHDPDSKWEIYQMHLFGFKVSERAKSGPRMRWLRERPSDLSELDSL